MGGLTRRQILIGTIVVLAILECLLWALGTGFSWRFRTFAVFEPLTPDQLFQNTEFAVLLSVMLLINVAGTLAFTFNRDGYGRTAQAVIQAANIAVTILTFVWRTTEPLLGLEFSVPPAFTLLLLAVLWRSFPRRA